MGSAAADEGAGAGAEPADGGAAFVSAGGALARG